MCRKPSQEPRREFDRGPWFDSTSSTRALDLCFADEQTVAVHCVAGLGRAPLLVSIALIEAGLDPMDAVELIRRKRRGAINRVQLKYVQDYTPVRRKSNGCAVM